MNMSQGFTQGGNFQGCKQQEEKKSYNSINKLSREAGSLYGQCKKSQLHVTLLIIILIVLITIIEIKKVY